mmetsp:Transcript_25098/g.54634  ORF Transcript_25098/g.54634 Transcript_25098/m.54634 type:complete len:359 (-) Transcript_25098:294-1370(-)|eukprot:CAMPEP_0206454868 /NCGR_PEP_ID=MMETSP0324_2-20121206/21400_1 /ASSEMBLY_ACC=CAM_ASM_000836 /TAXON_ID=2866 /ORGANISM="Crypthecodinium cohnii, Strain Seligo" /LENGTH=358 /DNA_ID=CAMNT_0053925437 /DNA_START=185 /DNA_END=1261 /DNA_ORIENTATION=-
MPISSSANRSVTTSRTTQSYTGRTLVEKDSRREAVEPAGTPTLLGAQHSSWKSPNKEFENNSEETTPTTTVSEGDSGYDLGDDDSTTNAAAVARAPQLGPGLYNDDQDERLRSHKRTPVEERSEHTAAPRTNALPQPPAQTTPSAEKTGDVIYSKEETLFVFDWDDTVLPSSWVQGQGLRLDDSSKVNSWQRERLAEVAALVSQTLRMAKAHGTVVLVTNAERGWIELSCQKFLPSLLPLLENVRIVSARTTYEGPRAPTPLDWKLRAFDVEIERVYGCTALQDPKQRKNVLSLGDGAHEREAMMSSTHNLPNCSAKSLKFVERPDINQILKQHTLVTGCFEQIVQHEGNLDLCIRCD